MLDIRNYLKDIHHVIRANSPAQLKMFAYRYMAENPDLKFLLKMDRATLKLYLNHLKKDVLPLVIDHLDEMTDDPMH